jgi:hypothetical protein
VKHGASITFRALPAELNRIMINIAHIPTKSAGAALQAHRRFEEGNETGIY